MAFGSTINSLGLILDIIGALLLLKYGIPNKIDAEGHINFILEQEDEAEKAKAKVYKNWSDVAVILIILGFVLQLISNFL